MAERANNQLCYKNESGMFVTTFICVLDLRTDDVTFINAGHNRPFVTTESGEFEMLPAKANLALGMMEDISYKEQHFKLSKGNCIYLYTDGVTEALNVEQEFFGDRRLKEVLNKHMKESCCVNQFVEAMYE